MALAPLAGFKGLNTVLDQPEDNLPDAWVERGLEMQFARELDSLGIGHKWRATRTVRAYLLGQIGRHVSLRARA